MTLKATETCSESLSASASLVVFICVKKEEGRIIHIVVHVNNVVNNSLVKALRFGSVITEKI